MDLSVFKNEVKNGCFDALETVGFTRFRKDGVDWPLGDGFHCWVGLSTGQYADRVEIDPMVGVHVEPIERICAMKTGRYPQKYDRGIATFGTNMGQVEAAQHEKAFVFGPSQSDAFLNSEYERLAQLYVSAGIEYAKSISNYETLLSMILPWIKNLGGYPERYACCLYLLGRRDEARKFVAEFLEKRQDYFEGFAEPFIQLLSEE